MRHAFFALCCLVCNMTVAQTDYAAYREHYKQEFLTEPRSPLTAADTAFLDFFEPQSKWAVIARLERTPESPAFGLPTYSGLERPYRQFGLLYFEIEGKPYRLCVYQSLQLINKEQYKNHLFLPFKDLTNGDATYGGGRYLDLSSSDIQPDNTLVIDFNNCYNPWCAYSDGYNCPIPPPVNHLDLAVEAGEKVFKSEKGKGKSEN